MPRKNQIHGYATQRLAGGRIGHYWRPSPRERREGWSTITFGTGDEGRRKALIGCIEQNEKVAAARASAAPVAAGPRARILRPRWRDLKARYLVDPAFTDLKPKSQREYRTRLAILDRWAIGPDGDEGGLILDQLDRAMVIDLRNALVGQGRKHRTANLLRMLSVFLGYGAEQGWVEKGLAAEIDIPTAPPRKRILAWGEVETLMAAAEAKGQGRMALAILLGFWTFQREADLLGLGRFNWREMNDMSPEARAILAGPDGRVLGFRLQQGKTGTWVDIALPWGLRSIVEAAFAAQAAADKETGLLLPDPGVTARLAALDGAPARRGRPHATGVTPRLWPQALFQRDFRKLVAKAGLADVQFRDLRRSGMVYFGGHSVALQFITAASGHAVLGRKTILDTYMPGNSRFAAEGMAIAWARHQAAIEAAKASGQG